MKPVITCKTYRSNDYYNDVDLVDKTTGKVLGKVVYSPHNPLSCGANVWIELDTDVIELVGTI